MKGTENPYQDLNPLSTGMPLEMARAAMLMLHGRGGTAQGILSLAEALQRPGFTYLAPQAADNSWYPFSFLEPLEKNRLWIDSSLKAVGELIERVEAQGIPADKLIILGFSQGACMGLEYAARRGSRFGGVVGLSGGLIGPPGTVYSYSGTLEGTPLFLGCSENDPHIPRARLEETADVFESLGAQVTFRLYPGVDHGVNRDEIDFIGRMMTALI
ncbi:MAG: phospholipase [Candidatus Glassbacteria bacterium RIFCSPLOWO2_12_FULL_58_11]|uniref:Phospholipase n=1 Tax=Candidatus Glassbacteria bacterium RIFCSPLOWO2_12_FULL_58_11 TaxID=1817867 RepID=A0A1F5YXH8_9BACT|nr:MAG: phospholipase [Candidatus Glassbacteria bacterium RIFCSPLOWO2_12_FULL_58_11]